MSSQYVIISAYPANSSMHDDVVQGLGESGPSRKLYCAVDGADVVELHALDDLGQIKDMAPHWSAQKQAVFMHLTGDVRRQVLSFVEAPKDCASHLPESRSIQLRYVEVKPPVYDAYRAWRERTIFEVVRRSPEVDVFLAYHTLLSTQPGVMFLSGFDGEIGPYEGVFESDLYRDIVRQAGDRYITGGPSGLSTRIYRRAPARRLAI